MSQDIGRVRIRVPASIKANDIVKVRALVIHPMEIIQRKDGKVVEKNYHFINRGVVSYLGKEITQFETTQSVSENPFFSFAFRATDPGPLKITFFDTHGGKFEGAVDIKFA
jgi:sulfur-oxidizing protein SoxZ